MNTMNTMAANFAIKVVELRDIVMKDEECVSCAFMTSRESSNKCNSILHKMGVDVKLLAGLLRHMFGHTKWYHEHGNLRCYSCEKTTFEDFVRAIAISMDVKETIKREGHYWER